MVKSLEEAKASYNAELITPMGYKFQSTLWGDFTVAEFCDGEAGIRDTYKRVLKEWGDDYIMLTELVLVLNWKSWERYEDGDEGLVSVYSQLWEEASAYADEHLEGEEALFYYRVTD